MWPSLELTVGHRGKTNYPKARYQRPRQNAFSKEGCRCVSIYMYDIEGANTKGQFEM